MDIVNVEMIAMVRKQNIEEMNPDILKSIYVNYYPISCIESKQSIYGTISYLFQGKTNEPNLTYINRSETTVFGKKYSASQLFLVPNRDAFKEFPFLGGSIPIPENVDAAIIILNQPITNGIEPIYTVIYLIKTNAASPETIYEAKQQILPLFNTSHIDSMKQITQTEPHILCLNDFLVEDYHFDPIHEISIYDDQYDHNGKKCKVGLIPTIIPIGVENFIPPPPPPSNGSCHRQITTIENPLLEGFGTSNITPIDISSATSSIGVDVGSMFKDFFQGKPSTNNGDTVPMGSLRIPLKDDPNYTYQECTMVPVDDIDMQNTEYVYQVSGNSSMIAEKTVRIQGNLLTYLVLYFIMFLLVYFGVPFVYAFIMCTLLKRGYNYTGFSGFIDYLKRPQNFLGLGRFSGFAVIFNIIYLITIIGTLFGSTYVTVWLIVMWIVGFIGVRNNPLPESCIFS